MDIFHSSTHPPDRFGIEKRAPSASVFRPPKHALSWRNWTPIRPLLAQHRPLILEHLSRLSPADRYLRYGAPTSDARITDYVLGLNFNTDEVFGIYNQDLKLIGVAHLSYITAPQIKGQPAMVEFAVSVDEGARGRGYGNQLFKNALLRARNRGTDRLFIHALKQNTAMLKIVQKAGATVEYWGPEAEAWLQLPADNVTSHLNKALEDKLSALIYISQLHMQSLHLGLHKIFDKTSS